MEEKIKMSKRTKNLIGQRFGRWVVLEFAGYKNNKAHWFCKCDCGKEKIVCGKNLTLGKTKSCGCLHNEQLVEYFTKHGARSKEKDKTERLYFTWKNMKSRCFNSSSKYYHRYGGRGINICDEWKNSYVAFKEWAISSGYSEKLTIERIDNNGIYCPENCRWATVKEQSRNRSTNIFLEYKGKTYILKDLATALGVDRKKLKRRIDNGMTVEQAISDIKAKEFEERLKEITEDDGE